MTEIILKTKSDLSEQDAIFLISEDTELDSYKFDPDITKYIKSRIQNKETIIKIVDYVSNFNRWFVVLPEISDFNKLKENIRKSGYEVFKQLEKLKIEHLTIYSTTTKVDATTSFLEGLLLSGYKFFKYKTTENNNSSLIKINLIDSKLREEEILYLKNLVKAVYITRNLVNEPLTYLTAEKFSEELIEMGKEAGFSVEVLHKSRIESLKMGGLLGVNKGSSNPPTFNILEHKPSNAVNSKPIVIIGKGVVFDTGGISLKPSEGLEMMKCDMAGGAAVAGILYTSAKEKLPLHIIGLIPATENRPAENAIVPGDILTIANGKTVEVINTDAEGRLILADALCYASKYNPELVIDLATLTGAAVRAIGKEGIVMMGTASQAIKAELIESGFEVYERIVEFPLWEEYEKQLKSDIADIKNLGSAEAGAITAGKFLEFFTNFPWIHLDIAGGAYLTSEDNYRGKNGTGIGVRLIYNFLKKQANNGLSR